MENSVINFTCITVINMQLYFFTLPYDLLDIFQLQAHIQNTNETIGAAVESCGYDSGTRRLTLVCSGELTLQDQQTIESRCASYQNPPTPPVQKITNLGLQKTDTQAQTWKTMFAFTYQHDPSWMISKIRVTTFGIPSLDQSTLEYVIRLVDVSTNTILGSVECSNVDLTINEISVVEEEFPPVQTLELQAKLLSKGTVIIVSGDILLEACDCV